MDFSTISLYVSTLVLFFIFYNILGWGLNVQYGYAGIPNFAYVCFMALGAYFTGVLGVQRAISPDQYVLGLGWPFPLTLIGGCVLTGVAAGIFGLLTLQRLRSDYLALTTFALGFVAYGLIVNYQPLFNGYQGITSVTSPLANTFDVSYNTYTYVFIGIAGAIMLLAGWVARRIETSPLGRTLNAIREDNELAEALGKNAFRFRLLAFVIGAMFAGLAGGLMIEYFTAFNPSNWEPQITFIVWAALLVGGRGNHFGVVLGVILVPVLFIEGTKLLPQIPGHPGLADSLRFVVIGFLIMLTLWVRPRGLLPERRQLFDVPARR